MITARIYGDRKIDLADELEEEFRPEAVSAVREGSQMLLDEVRRLLSLRSGPEPAPPGEPPARQSGALIASWRLMPIRARGRFVSGGVTSKSPEAWILEYGITAGTAKKIASELYAVARQDRANLGPQGGLRQSKAREIRAQAEEMAKTRESVRLQPRPYLRPAVANMEGPIGGLLEERLR